MKGYNSIDCMELSKYDLEDIFYFAAVSCFECSYPNEKISKESVNYGNVYKNKTTISCQVKFLKNNAICQCTYYQKTKRITCKMYRLENIRYVIYAKIEGEDKPSYLILDEKKLDE